MPPHGHGSSYTGQLAHWGCTLTISIVSLMFLASRFLVISHSAVVRHRPHRTRPWNRLLRHQMEVIHPSKHFHKYITQYLYKYHQDQHHMSLTKYACKVSHQRTCGCGCAQVKHSAKCLSESVCNVCACVNTTRFGSAHFRRPRIQF